jgi:two-component system LytT family sensor kinase
MMLRKIRKNNRYQTIFSHALFWLFSIVLFTVVLFYTRDFSLSDIDLKTAINIIITILLLAVSVYINLLWLLPVFFKRRRFLLFSFFQLGNILLFILLNYYISVLFEGGAHPNFFNEAVAEFILVLIFLIVSSLLKFVRDSFTLQDAERRIRESERQQMEAELKALKAQINPHFFFNTLNSLYSLTIDRSEKAPELILKLSELMRYVIYEAKEDFETIERQLDFIKSYVYLESLRVGDHLKVDVSVKGENLSLRVAPLLFIAFVENAFKHCSRDKAKDPFISIIIDIESRHQINFYIENTKEADLHHFNPPIPGIGLQNVRKRLELLYPGRHTLIIKESNDRFIVDLILIVNENPIPDH